MCFLDSHQSRNKLPGVKVGGRSWGVKTEITPTTTEPPEPYQNTTHHCSQSMFYYDTNYNFGNKQRKGGWIPSPYKRMRVWVGISGQLHFVSVAPTQVNAIYLRLASWTGRRFPFALIGIMSVGQFLHHLQAAETKHVQKESYKLILLHLTKHSTRKVFKICITQRTWLMIETYFLQCL